MTPSEEAPVMKGSKLRFGLFLLLWLGVIAVLAVVGLRSIGDSQTRVLPDGSRLRLVGVSCGNSNYYAEPQPKQWQMAIGKYLPFPLASGLGWWFRGGDWKYTTSPPGISNLVLFVVQDGPGKVPSIRPSRMFVFDDQGDRFEPMGEGGISVGTDPGKQHFHSFWSILVEIYPRRSKTIRIRFLGDLKDGKGEVTLAEFRVPNPNPGPFPVWVPEAVPDVKRAGDVTATLTEFTTGLSAAHHERMARDDESRVTRFTVRLEQTDRTNCLWIPVATEVSDATGNRWRPYIRPVNGAFSATFSGTLWPGEAAWKLRVELSRTNGFAPEELWSASTAVPAEVAPSAGSSSSVKVNGERSRSLTNTPESAASFSTNIDGCSVRLRASRAGSSAGKSNRGGFNVNLSVSTDDLPEGLRMTLLNVSDDHGRAIKFKASSGRTDRFQLSVPPDASRLDYVLSLSRSRFVEFVVSPKRGMTNF